MVQKYIISFGGHGRLSGLLLLPDRTEPVPGAILCHGLGSGLGAVRPSALRLAKQGIASFIFDFRGHGRSKGVFDGRQVEDVVEAWQWLTRFDGVDKTRIVLIGHSMGAAAAILATCYIGSPRAIVALACPPEPDEKRMQGARFDLRHWLGKRRTLLEYPKDGTLPWLSGVHAVIAWGWTYLRGYRLLINWEKNSQDPRI